MFDITQRWAELEVEEFRRRHKEATPREEEFMTRLTQELVPSTNTTPARYLDLLLAIVRGAGWR